MELPSSAERVQALLAAAGSTARVVTLSETARTANDAAAAIGCDVAQIAKSLVFRSASNRPVIVIASGRNRVDERKIAVALGEPIGKADAEFVRAETGYAIGGVSPIGHRESSVIFIDAHLAQCEPIWAAAGHPHAVFSIGFEELVRLTAGTVVAIG